MKILISQPIHEAYLEQLRDELTSGHDFDAVLFPEGYIKDEETISDVCDLARKHRKMVITGYKNRNNKDRALIIDHRGEIILERAKSPMTGRLFSPSSVSAGAYNIGYLLCVELLQGLDGLAKEASKLEANLDFIAHPIGVGMFSEEQYQEWIDEAKQIAMKYNTVIMGASHADGSYKNCGFSIPIAYCIDPTGEPLFISKNDLRTRIVDINSREIQVVEVIS